MTSHTTNADSVQPVDEAATRLFDNWFDPIETEVRARAREFIEDLIRSELDTALARPRYGRGQKAVNEGRAGLEGHRHGSRTRSLTGTFGPVEIEVPRARLNTPAGKTTEWKSQALRAYQRRTLAADALIASCYLAGTNTRRAPCARGAVRRRGFNPLLTLMRHGGRRIVSVLAREREKPMQAAKSLPPAFDTLIKTDMTSAGLVKTDQKLLGAKQPNATEPGDDIVAFGANSIGEIEKLMEELRIARDYLRSEGERVRRINVQYAHLTQTASASVKIIAESMGKWRTTELDAVPDAGAGPSGP